MSPEIEIFDIKIKIMLEGKISHKFLEQFHNGSRDKATVNMICQLEMSPGRTITKNCNILGGTVIK